MANDIPSHPSASTTTLTKTQSKQNVNHEFIYISTLPLALAKISETHKLCRQIKPVFSQQGSQFTTVINALICSWLQASFIAGVLFFSPWWTLNSPVPCRIGDGDGFFWNGKQFRQHYRKRRHRDGRPMKCFAVCFGEPARGQLQPIWVDRLL